MLPRRRCPRSVALLGVLLAGLVGAAPPKGLPALDANRQLPINLEAAASQFDGNAGRLSFRDVRITQGSMAVRAASGEVARLDFEDSLWTFTDSVVLDNAGTHIECDVAELRFRGHQLRSATFRGKPVRFRQERPGATATEGRAGIMEYDVDGASIRLSGAAWISDGENEVSGERMAYDLDRRRVTAESGGDGAVRMKIRPPARNGTAAAP